jgi:hypothetical protein
MDISLEEAITMLYPEKLQVRDERCCENPDIVDNCVNYEYVCKRCGTVINFYQYDEISESTLKRNYKGYSKLSYFLNKISWLTSMKCMRPKTTDAIVKKITEATYEYSFESIYDTMIKLKLRKYINYIYFIYERINRKPLITLSKQEINILIKLFLMIEKEYIKLNPYKNFFMMSFLLSKLFKMINRHDIIPYLKMYKVDKTYDKKSKLFDRICENLKLK